MNTNKQNFEKRKKVINTLEKCLKSDNMSICHEAIFTEDLIKEILKLLKNNDDYYCLRCNYASEHLECYDVHQEEY